MLAATAMLVASAALTGVRVGVALPGQPVCARSRCILARERTQIGDTARDLTRNQVERVDAAAKQVGFSRPQPLKVLVPLNPRHFSDAVNYDGYRLPRAQQETFWNDRYGALRYRFHNVTLRAKFQ